MFPLHLFLLCVTFHLETQIGQDGRPFHAAFFTGQPAYHELIFVSIWEHMQFVFAYFVVYHIMSIVCFLPQGNTLNHKLYFILYNC